MSATATKTTFAGSGRLAWGTTSEATANAPRPMPSDRTGEKGSIARVLAMASVNMGTVAMTIAMTPAGRWETARYVKLLGRTVPSRPITMK